MHKGPDIKYKSSTLEISRLELVMLPISIFATASNISRALAKVRAVFERLSSSIYESEIRGAILSIHLACEQSDLNSNFIIGLEPAIKRRFRVAMGVHVSVEMKAGKVFWEKSEILAASMDFVAEQLDTS